MAEKGKQMRPRAEVEELTRFVLTMPLHQFLGLELVHQEQGHAVAKFTAGPSTLNYIGAMHGGIAYALLDVVCYLALLPMLGSGQHAVSHNIHVSMLRPVLSGQEVELRGRVIQKGRNVAFCEGEAWAAGRLTARAQVTKSLVRSGPAA